MANPFLASADVSFNDFKGKRAGYGIANNLLLGDGVIILDCDFHECSFTEAKQDALRIQDYLHERGYPIAQVKFSGRGFQILVVEHDLTLPQAHPKVRFKQYRQKRVPLANDLKQRGIQFDEEVLLNPKTVVRTIGTVNSKSGHVCATLNSLENFSEEDAERMRLPNFVPVTPSQANDIISSLKSEAAESNWERTGRTTQKAKFEQTHPAIPTIYLGSRAIGTFDRQIIMLRFPSDTDVKVLKERLSRFALNEQLAPFLIFTARKDPEAIYALSPSAIQFGAMRRLLKRFRTDNVAYQKFQRRIAPMKLKFIDETSGVIDSERPVCRGMWRYLYRAGVIDWTPRVLAGANITHMPLGEMKS
jgi:hypothetical protein